MYSFKITVLLIVRVSLIHAGENSLIIVGGITELHINDPYTSETVTNNTDILGCSQTVSLPSYPEAIFGSLLSYWQESL